MYEGNKNTTCGLEVRHILPKANQIVKTADQNIRGAYPFNLLPPFLASHTQRHPPTNYQEVSRPQRPFHPPRSTIQAHFDSKSIIYDKFNLPTPLASNICSIDRLKELRKNDFILSIDRTTAKVSENGPLQFDSRFECGNLSEASWIDGVYCLLLHNDVNTSGYTNWFYFRVTPRYSCKATLAIMNYGKAGWPLNQFPAICAWKKQKGWYRHSGVSCVPNHTLYSQETIFKNFKTLSFSFEFVKGEDVFFAYSPPYAYTDLLKMLDSIEQNKPIYFHRKLAGTSLLGNRLEMVTITNFQKKNNPVIVLLGRSHAGQTTSSWIMHHLIEFLVSNQEQARVLRDNFLFKIFPMINPDGVVHGNYRCSLIGRDLNRRWKAPSKELYPEVYFIKNQIYDTLEKRQIRLVLDLHGHTQKRGAFFYGCAERNAPHRARLFPYLASKLTQQIEFGSCNFAIEKSKQCTARITLFNILRCPEVFTLQTSMFGMGREFLSSENMKNIADGLIKTILKYFRIPKFSGSNQVSFRQEKQDGDLFAECQAEMMSNPQLLKVGCDLSDGSDSQPSQANINFDKLSKMSAQTSQTVRPTSQIRSRKQTIPPRPMSQFKHVKPMRQVALSMEKSRNLSIQDGYTPPAVSLKRSRTYKRQEKRPAIVAHIEDKRELSFKERQWNELEIAPVRMINFELLIQDTKRKRERGPFSSALKSSYPVPTALQKRQMFRNRSFNKSSM